MAGPRKGRLTLGTNTALLCKAVFRAPSPNRLGRATVSGGGWGGASVPDHTKRFAHTPSESYQRQRSVGAINVLTRAAGPPLAAGADHLQPKEHHHGKSEEDRPQGREEDREGQGATEGPRQMNLTLTQSFHRTQTLSGELKAAESALADCEADAQAKERIASIAAEAVEKAKGHLEALRQEREELANHMAALVRKTGDALELPEPESPFWRGDLQAQALENGAARITDAFNEATR